MPYCLFWRLIQALLNLKLMFGVNISAENAGSKKGALAVLNKIDGLWDELKDETEIQKELAKQVTTSADLLGLETTQIFPNFRAKRLIGKSKW